MRCWRLFSVVLALLAGCSASRSDEPVPEEGGTVSAQEATPWELCGLTALPVGLAPAESVEESPALAQSGGGLLYSADDGAVGQELWASSGSGGVGTRLVKDLLPGPGGSEPLELTRVGSLVYFAANDPVYGRELFVSDGTPAGTRLVKDIWPGDTGSFPRSFHAFNGLLYFSAGDPDHGRELWRSDGTADGTFLVEDLDPGPEGTSPDRLTRASDGSLYFLAQFRGFHTALMRSSAGGPGAVELFSIPSERGIQAPLVPIGSRLFFVAGAGHEAPVSLMVTGGGALPVRLGSFGEVHAMAALGGKLFFSASPEPGSMDLELWRSDGTVAGTVLLKELRAGPEGSDPGGFVVLGRRLFFSADDGMHGGEPWVTDGTAAGTRLFADLEPGAGGSAPRGLVAFQGGLFFSAETAAHGREPWASDGTPGGTVPLEELAPGAPSSDPGGFMRAGWDVFFSADDGTHGRRLYALPFRPEGKCTPQAW